MQRYSELPDPVRASIERGVQYVQKEIMEPAYYQLGDWGEAIHYLNDVIDNLKRKPSDPARSKVVESLSAWYGEGLAET